MTENFDEMNPDMAAGTEIQPYTVCEPVEVTNEFSDFDETMNSSALSQVLTSDDDDLSSPSISEPDSSSDEDKYETASEDRGHHRRGRVPHMTANYSATSNKQSSVKKDKKSVIQNNIRIRTMIGNLHVGPSFSAMTSDQWRMPSPRNRPSSADRHLEQCLSSDRIVEDSELESIAGAIGENWKDIGKVLKIKPDHLDFLDRQNCSTVKNRNAPFRMLYIWAQKNDQKATVKRLAKAFLKAGETDAVKALRS